MFYKLQKAALIVEDGIIKCHFHTYSSIEVEDIKELLMRVIEINRAAAFRHALLLDVSEMIFINQESRHYLDQNLENQVIALAFHAVSNLQSQMVSLFMNFKKSKVPSRSFSSKDEAMIWLSSKLSHLTL